MKQLIYEINSKKYLLFELPIVNREESKKIEKAIKNCDGIIQGATIMSFGFWTRIPVLNVLIPEENIKTFSNEIV